MTEPPQNHQPPPPRRITLPRLAEPPFLPCPRCESTNTKFCYYNNYNLSQPRYCCKSCRRFWTVGGALRNVPVGGGIRKRGPAANKKKKPKVSSLISSAASSPSSSTTNDPGPLTRDPDPLALNHDPNTVLAHPVSIAPKTRPGSLTLNLGQNPVPNHPVSVVPRTRPDSSGVLLGHPVCMLPRTRPDTAFRGGYELNEDGGMGFTSLLNLQHSAGSFLEPDEYGFHLGLGALGFGSMSDGFGSGRGEADSGCETWLAGDIDSGSGDGAEGYFGSDLSPGQSV